MRNKMLSRVAKVFGFVAVVAMFPSAQAVQITMNVPDCPAGQTLGFTSATNTLSCSGTQQPVNTPSGCSISSSPSSAVDSGLAAGTQVSLTALCTGGVTPVSYSWNIGVIGAGLTVAPQSTTNYVVTPSNSAGAGQTFSATVYIGSTSAGSAPPSNCSISQSPNTISSAVTPGANVTLSLTCASGSPVSSCTWSNGIPGSACTVNVTAPQSTVSYTGVASNSAGVVSTSTTINVNSTPVNNNVGQILCTGSDTQINVGWPGSGQGKQNTNGFNNQRIAFKITIPSAFNPPLNINHLGFMRLVEVPGSTVTGRDYTISRNACDFTKAGALFYGVGNGDTAPYISFSVNNPQGYLAAGATLNFNSGETIYFNVRNYNESNPTCPYSSCDISIDFATPNRY